LRIVADGLEDLLTRSAVLRWDAGSWCQSDARGPGSIALTRRRDGWWLDADSDLGLEGLPIVASVPLGGPVRIGYQGASVLTLAVEPQPPSVWDYWVATDRGPRFHQQDAVFASPWSLVAADGVGSRPAADVAAVGVVTAVGAVTLGGPRAAEIVTKTADAAVANLEMKGVGDRGMATTLTAAMGARERDGIGVTVVHVGDSALLWYSRSQGRLSAMTTPHNVRGQPNVLLRAIGDDPAPVSEKVKFCGAPGDAIVACTDGLVGVVELHRIEEIVATYIDKGPEVLAEELIGAAIKAGTSDNVSVAVGVISPKGDTQRGLGTLPAAGLTLPRNHREIIPI
jgi:serine/threonine protein phosphatase PrpC